MANTQQNSGLNTSDLLGVLFIELKLGHVIDWSWWWVLAPFWIAFAAALLVHLLTDL